MQHHWAHLPGASHARPTREAHEHDENAYRLGDAAQRTYGKERRWEELEPAMAADWPRFRGESALDWQDARGAARSAWEGGTSGKVLNKS